MMLRVELLLETSRPTLAVAAYIASELGPRLADLAQVQRVEVEKYD